ncbi:hypothetical protein SD71_18245 [Cohnella kolymensis]|uniref:Uncharacterized protein n=1 Tax=Cohnella kolymensis TaxID=1590652 RepID=A0ABR5A0W2_9BACL|nr:hypothetical protein [Cohnella kolymensis]KIL34693.1 hypothetical protein SD71_18245 [Cohnella kolymensis]
MVKTIVDYQISQPLIGTTTGAILIPASPSAVSLAEFGLNVTSAVNDVVIQGLVGITSTLLLPQLAVKVLRDHSLVVFAEQVNVTSVNSVEDVPIIFTDINAPMGFHSYTLTVELLFPSVTTGAFVIGPITLSGTLLQ